MTATLEPRLQGRRVIDPAVRRRFHASMRNDFLTPRGTPYKWHEMTATLHRTILGGGVPTVVPVRYEWERVSARTGDPKTATEPREWTFARGQGFTSMLLHADAGPEHAVGPGGDSPVTLDVSYPALPKSPAVDLLLMLSWDVVTFEMMCTHLITTAGLREVGGRAELERISGSWAELQFSDPGATAVFRNAHISAEHLGTGRFAGRESSVYQTRCLDCVLDVKSGPVRQRGRSSYWVTLQVDTLTGDLLCAEMTEMIVATLIGPDGGKVPVQKRRTVRMWADEGDEPAPVSIAAAAVSADPALLAEAVTLTERVADYLTWQIRSLGHLPAGMADLALMGFRSVVGTDLAGAGEQVGNLLAALRAGAAGEPGAAALPEYRRLLEGLLAFGQIAVDGQTRLLVPDEASRVATRDRLGSVGDDLTALLARLEQLERPDRPGSDCEAMP
ncbi:hypothetical protein [Dactylosporangium sp. CA-233914]|uniref:hypothetical protein n=1 Tax=Dactylosporangium sp. CA-233914 TaxID=3239934 RepID=UPI003D94987D